MLKKTITNDSSETFYNPDYDETYKSTSGAVQESVEKFARPARVQEIASRGAINLLDICFGLGYNSAAAIDLILGKNPNCKVSIVGLENDPEIMAKTAEVSPGFKHYSAIQNATKKMHFSEGNIDINLIAGDARKTIKLLEGNYGLFDAVFLDPFSPKKCPELWTAEFLSNIIKLMRKGAILTTYSCAGIVRKNLSKAGFSVKEGPCIGRRSPSLVAIKS